MTFRPLLPAIALAVALPCTSLAEGHVSADTVVATVGETDITLGHMMVMKQRLPGQYQQLPPDILFNGILDQLVQQTLLGQEVDALSTGSIKTIENEERAIRASEAIVDLTEERVTDEAVQSAYDAAYSEGEPEWDVSHILFTAEGDAAEDDPAVAEARAKAEQAIADLGAGADFAELARERSEGPSGPNGGKLGWYGEGALVPEFENAMKAMEPGTVSAEPVRTQFGYHVIQLHGTRTTEPPALDLVRGEIVDTLQREAVEARVAELEETVEVTRDVEGIDPAVLDDLSLLEN